MPYTSAACSKGNIGEKLADSDSDRQPVDCINPAVAVRAGAYISWYSAAEAGPLQNREQNNGTHIEGSQLHRAGSHGEG